MPIRFPCGGAPCLGARLLRTALVLSGGFYPATRVTAAGASPARVLAGWHPEMELALVLLVLGLAAVWWWERRRRLQSDARFSSANDRLRALFDESPLSICVFDPNDREIPFRIVECNQYACDLHGRTREELVGQSMGVLTPLKMTYEGAQHFLSQLRKGPCRGENPHCKKDGTVFYIEYVARLVIMDGREYMIGVDRDLTAERARRASEQELRYTAELNQLVLRASNDGIWDWDIRKGYITFSHRCREMLGYTAEELPDNGPQWMELIHPEDQVMHEGLLRRHWEEGSPYVYQHRVKHKDGNWRWIISRAITLFDETHRPLRMVGCRTDITEMKRIDAELLQSRKLRAVGEMVGGIAHEFNNLLTPMLLHAELIGLDHGNNPKLAAHIGPIRIGIDRAKELTQRILTFGRRSVDAREFLRLEAVVRDNLDFLGQTIDRRIQISLQAPLSSAVIWANRSDINQLIVNLILNARDTLLEKEAASPPSGWTPRVVISLASLTRASGAREETDTHTPRHWHRLTVSDNGMGMSEEVKERVFEPFFTTKGVGRGTGLGLATAWHVSTALGGWIEIESKAGAGTTFHVFLPAANERKTTALALADPSKTAEHATSRQRSLIEASMPTPPRRRVLLVEDSEIVGDATQRMLESFGYEVQLVTDGQEAWTALSAQPDHYDVVFTDLNLPGISGLELVRKLRAAGYKNRVVVYSGYFSAEHEAALEGLKVDHLLQKPFSRAQLGPILE